MSDVTEIEIVDRIAVLRLNRPDNLNALTVDLARGIADGLIALDTDDAVERFLFLHGTPRIGLFNCQKVLETVAACAT